MVDVVHKILVPHLPTHLVERPRLLALLETVRERQLVLLTAAAGYGKTSLLTEWAHSAQETPICWYSLDRYDADPHTFMTYLAASVLQRYPDRLPLTTARVQQDTSWNIDQAIATLGQELYHLGEPVILVFDDWHLVDEVDEIGRALAELLRRAPNCRAILASRSYPTLPNIMLLVAHGQVTGLAEGLLRFTADEAAAVLERQALNTETTADIAALTERANGWITAIVLMARAPDLVAQASVGHNSEQWVYAFLTEQVFDRLEDDLQTFLYESALLEELEARSCDALLGRNDSALLLDRLVRQHLFVTEIDQGVLRYHPLFREFLITRFRHYEWNRFQQTALRIALGYAEQRQWAQAFDLCLLADATAQACDVLERGGEILYHQGHLATLERAFAALAVEQLSATLLCLKGRLRLSGGQAQEAVALAELAQTKMRPDEVATVRLFQAALAQSLGDYAEAIGLATSVLDLAATDAQQGAALRIAANCHGRRGNEEAAITLLTEALQIQRRRGDLYHLALLSHDLGITHERTGRLHEAERCYQQAEGYWTTLGNIGARALSRNNAAVIQHLLGRYREAHALLQEARRDARATATAAYEATIGASLGDLYCDLGLWDQAEESYAEARGAGGSAFIQGYIDVALVRLLVYRHQFGIAATALDQLDASATEQHTVAIRLLRATIALGRRWFEQAHAEASSVITADEPGIDNVRACVLEARILAERAQPRLSEVLAYLDRAVQQTQALGYDAFLVATFAQHPALLRQAALADWEPAATFAARVESLRRVAQQLVRDDGVAVVNVCALGIDQIEVNGDSVDIGLLKAREAWFYLLSHPRGAVADELRDVLWPERDAQSAQYLLRTAIHRVRSALPDDLIVLHQRRLYRVERGAARVEYDVEHFLQRTDSAVTDPDILLDGLELYRGPFLPWSDNQWATEQRTMLEQRFVQTLHRCGLLYEQVERFADALSLYTRVLALDALDEAAVAGVMRCQIAIGNRAAAVEAYHRMRLRLDEELGLTVDQTSEVELLYSSILQGA